MFSIENGMPMGRSFGEQLEKRISRSIRAHLCTIFVKVPLISFPTGTCTTGHHLYISPFSWPFVKSNKNHPITSLLNVYSGLNSIAFNAREVCPTKQKTQYVHWRFIAIYFLFPWRNPAEMSRQSISKHYRAYNFLA